MNKKHVIQIAAATAVVLVAILAATQPKPESLPASKHSSGEKHPAALPTFSSAAAPSEQLPPIDSSTRDSSGNQTLIERFSALRNNEDVRDAQVLEALLDDFYTCRFIPRSERAKDRYQMNARQRMATLESGEQRASLEAYLQSVEACGSYTPDWFASALTWVEELADSGDLDAQLLYLVAAGPTDWEWQLDPQKLSAFGARIAGYYDAAAAEPVSAEAFEFLSELHQTSYLGPPDPVLSFAYRFAMHRSQGLDYESIRDRALWFLDEDELEAAELIAGELLAECCP